MTFSLSGNPEYDAMRYAQVNGLSLSDAKNKLRAQFGDPPPQNFMVEGQQKFYQSPVSPEQMTGIQYNIPPEVVMQGDDAIRKFAMENGINIPKKQINSTVASNETSSVSSNDSSVTTKTYSKREIKSFQRQMERWSSDYRNMYKKDYKAKYKDKKLREINMDKDSREYAMQMWNQLHPGESCPVGQFKY